MDEKEYFLIRTLARSDAIFLPFRGGRFPCGDFTVNCWEARENYQKFGIDYCSEARSAAGRKSAQRDLESLTDIGLIAQHKQSGRTAFVKLTEGGEEIARAMCGLPTLRESDDWHRALALLADRCYPEDWSPAGQCYEFAHRFIPDTLLCPGIEEANRQAREGRGDAMATHLMDMIDFSLAPVAIRGLVKFAQERTGWTYWYVTEAGDEWRADIDWRLLKNEDPFDIAKEKELETLYSEDFRRSYIDCFEATVNELSSTPRKNPNQLGSFPIIGRRVEPLQKTKVN